MKIWAYTFSTCFTNCSVESRVFNFFMMIKNIELLLL